MEHETRLWMLPREHPDESKDHVTSVLRSEEDERWSDDQKNAFGGAHSNGGILRITGCLGKKK